jgi:hypothetical protein
MSRRGARFRRASCLIVVTCARAASVCCRCWSLCSLLCDRSCAVPAFVISPHSSLLSVGLCVRRLFIFESQLVDVASRGFSCRVVVIFARAAVCYRFRSLCLIYECSCAVPAPVTSPHSTSLSVGLGVCRVFANSRWSGGGALHVGAVLGLRVGFVLQLRVFAVVASPANSPHFLFVFGAPWREFPRFHTAHTGWELNQHPMRGVFLCGGGVKKHGKIVNFE